MTRAYQLGQWVRNNRTAATLVLVVVVVVVAVIVTKIGQEPASTPPQAKLTQEDIEKARQAAEADAQRRAEAERQEEERRRKQEEDWARAKRAIVENMKRDIKACVSVVRQWTDTKFHKGFSSFDAYATGEYAEHISFFGTAEERFQFQKCMAERGNPLSDPKAEKKEN